MGTADNTCVITWGTADPADYTVTEKLGILTVTANDTAVVITAASAEKTYDGTALTADDFEVEGLPAGFTLTAVVTGSRTDAGTGENTVTGYTILNAENNDVTASFTGVATKAGELKVIPAALTLTAPSAGKVYDGTELTADGLDPVMSGLPEGFSVVCTYSGSQTNAGSSDSEIATCKVMKGGENVTANFDITTMKGTLLVTERTITINTESLSYARAYNGEPISPESTSSPTVTGEFAAGDVLDDSVVSVYEEQINAGYVEIGYKINWTDEAKAQNYTISLEPGTLTVEPLSVIFNLQCSDPFEYDGNPHGCEWIEATLGNSTKPEPMGWDIDEESVSWIIYSLIGEDWVKLMWNCFTDIGTYTIDGIEQFLSGGSRNYSISYQNNTVEITEAEITFRAVGEEDRVYNGEPAYGILEIAPERNYEKIGGGKYRVWLTETDTVIVTITGGGTDAGEYDLVCSYAFESGGESNSKITTENGKQTVENAAITVTAPTPETKMYDGTALTADGLDPVVSGLPEGFSVVCTYSGSQTDAGSSDSEIATCKVMKGGEDVTANFDITTGTGTLTVTERNVTISTEALSYGRQYNGYPIHPDNTAPPTGIEDFVPGEVENIESTYAEQIDVGSVQIGYEVTWSGEAKPGNYSITLVPGTLEVTERNVTVCAGGGTFEYTGDVLLPNPEAFYTNSGEQLDVDVNKDFEYVTAVIKLIGGDTLTLVCRGYKELGSSYNVIEYETFTGISGNYNIIYEGTLMDIVSELPTNST